MTTTLSKKYNFIQFGKLNSKELYNTLILSNYKKPTSQRYFEGLFESSTNNVLYLNKLKSPPNS